MRRAVARGRSAARAISLSVIGAVLSPNARSSRRPRSRLSTKSVARTSPFSRFSLGMRAFAPTLLKCGLHRSSPEVTILNKCSIYEQASCNGLPPQARFHEVTRHDEPGTERPDHAHRSEGRLRKADADVLAAGSPGR